MSEAEFAEHFKSHGWRAVPIENIGWTFQHPSVKGVVQVSGEGYWWHVDDKGRDARAGHGLSELKNYLTEMKQDRQIRWTGKEPEREQPRTR